jgi:hypothetical protein
VNAKVTELLKLLDEPGDACVIHRHRDVQLPAGRVALTVDMDATALTDAQLHGLLAVLRAFERLREQP